MRINIYKRIYLKIFHEEYNVSEKEIIGKSRERPIFYCRLIFCNFLKNEGFRKIQIAKSIKKSKGAVHYFLIKYQQDFKWNKQFSSMVLEVEKLKKQKLKAWRIKTKKIKYKKNIPHENTQPN